MGIVELSHRANNNNNNNNNNNTGAAQATHRAMTPIEIIVLSIRELYDYSIFHG